MAGMLNVQWQIICLHVCWKYHRDFGVKLLIYLLYPLSWPGAGPVLTWTWPKTCTWTWAWQFYFQTNLFSQLGNYQTIPYQNVLGQFLGIFGAKVPKRKWNWFEDTYPLNQWGVLSWKILVSPYDQFEKLHFCSADMWIANVNTWIGLELKHVEFPINLK